MATLAGIRDALKTVLEETITGLQVYPRIGSALILPAVVVAPAEEDPLVTSGRASVSWQLDLHVIASAADTELGQYALDDLIDTGGDRSIIAALFDTDLGLDDTDCLVSGMTGYGLQWESIALDHVGATLRLLVHTTGAS